MKCNKFTGEGQCAEWARRMGNKIELEKGSIDLVTQTIPDTGYTAQKWLELLNNDLEIEVCFGSELFSQALQFL